MPRCPTAPAHAPGQARASSGQDPCPVLLLLFLPSPAPANLGIPGKGPSGPQLLPEPALSLCPNHPGSTHMWPPGRSSLVSIPSFSISICRKVLTFCRVSSSEYLWGTGKMRTAVLGLVSSPAARPPAHPPSPQSRGHFPACNDLSKVTPPPRFSVLGRLKAYPFCTNSANQSTKQTNYQPNKHINYRKCCSQKRGDPPGETGPFLLALPHPRAGLPPTSRLQSLSGDILGDK